DDDLFADGAFDPEPPRVNLRFDPFDDYPLASISFCHESIYPMTEGASKWGQCPECSLESRRCLAGKSVTSNTSDRYGLYSTWETRSTRNGKAFAERLRVRCKECVSSVDVLPLSGYCG